VHHRAKLREALGEPPVPATDFEDTFAMPIGDASERAHFILFRINVEGHLSSLLWVLPSVWLQPPKVRAELPRVSAVGYGGVFGGARSYIRAALSGHGATATTLDVQTVY
jgi:hypothetical protein